MGVVAALPFFVSTLSYAGALLLLVGSLSLVKPLRFLHVYDRRTAAVLLPLGALLAYSGAWWPWTSQRASGPSRLDALLPEFQFQEFHEARVHATPRAIDSAIHAVTAGEIRTFRTLTFLRSPRWPWTKRRESILEPRWDEPILAVATRTSFVWLADEPAHELAVGTVVCCHGDRVKDGDSFLELTRPGVAKAVMNFRIEPQQGGFCRVTTETRVYATDTAARRRFGLYWAFIYPGSALIRDGWLGAIKKRAEADR